MLKAPTNCLPKSDNVEKWFPNQGKGFFDKYFPKPIFVGKVHYEIGSLSSLFPKSVKGEISRKTIPTICTFKDSVWTKWEGRAPT